MTWPFPLEVYIGLFALVALGVWAVAVRFGRQYGRRRTPKPLRARAVTGASNSASPSDSGLGMTVGADGVSPHAEIGSGVGVDLKDGSITIGTGPVKWDLDGSGPKFKLF